LYSVPLLTAFTDVIGPVLLIGLAGYLLGRIGAVDTRALTSLAASILVPALMFSALSTSALPRVTFLRLAAFVAVQLLLVGLVIGAAARIGRWNRRLTAGMLLATLFSNAGNAGMPLAFFAWGDVGLAAATGFFVISAVPTNLLAAYIAAQASGNAAAGLRALVRLPVTYAIIAGLAFNLSGMTPPAPVAKAAQLLAGGAVAVMLLLVGAQLSTVHVDGGWRGIATAAATRLIFAPIVGWGTAGALGLDGVVRQTSILQASLPTAVTSAIWASEFGAEPALVSSAVVVTTLLSPLTITPLLVLLR
jgi:malate permease and related proteins